MSAKDSFPLPVYRFFNVQGEAELTFQMRCKACCALRFALLTVPPTLKFRGQRR